jgi:CRP-like cAMP-binding protein
MTLLRTNAVFAPLSPTLLEPIARSASYVEVDAQCDLIRQGDHGDHFYVVASGTFDVIEDGEFVRAAQRGGSFGEVALLSDVPRTATVTATAPSLVLAVHRDEFLAAVTGSETAAAAAWSAYRSATGRSSEAGRGGAPPHDLFDGKSHSPGG